jgi:membrane-bound lytic murein transglycosylase D
MKNIWIILTLYCFATFTIAAQPDVVKQRLSRLPDVIEMPYNEAVQKCIDSYTADASKRNEVGLMLGRMNFYVAAFEEALEAEGLPLELRYLPMVESRLKTDAVSREGAAGLWQLGITTAKEQGLEVTSLVDERCDIQKSSKAAAHLLKGLHATLGDWELAIAAFRGGLPTVSKALQRSGGVKDFWKAYNYLPAEVRSCVPQFIAANYIMTYYCEHGITPVTLPLPSKSDTVTVHHKLALGQVAAVCDIPLDTLKVLNPQYRAGIVPEGYSLRLPLEKVNVFIGREDDVHTYEADKWLTTRTEVAVPKTVSRPAARRTTNRRRRR